MDYSKYENHLPYPTGPRTPERIAGQRAYNEETRRLTDLFKADLIEEYGMTGHPRANRAFDIAWERGHSSGYSEVAIYFGELAELLVEETAARIQPSLNQHFAVFNLHKNDAGKRADAEFTRQMGQVIFDTHIKPCHDAGIMSIFQGPRTAERAIWVALCTLFSNGELPRG